MAQRKGNVRAALIKELERLARRLRAEFRTEKAGLPKGLKAAATELGKKATVVTADRVERYMNELLTELRARVKDAAAASKKKAAKAKVATKKKPAKRAKARARSRRATR